MIFSSNSDAPKRTRRRQSLGKVLEQNEHIRDMVAKCVEELSRVNAILKQEVALEKNSLSSVFIAIEKNDAIEKQFKDVIGQLILVNRALAIEERGRRMVDHELAAAIEQADAARNDAFHDVLTGLPNRMLFNDRVQDAFAQAIHQGWMLAVMFVDLDGFKTINDTYGHDTGDVVLETIARRLKEITRGEDTVSRHGGDEFLYLVTNIRDAKNIAMIAEKICQAIQAPLDVCIDNRQISLSIKVTIGIATYPKDGATADSLIKSADAAMYRAKRAKSGEAIET